MVAELECSIPGCPPRETVIAFWTAAGERRQFRLFKTVDTVAADDLPPWWMRDALLPPNYADCQCC